MTDAPSDVQRILSGVGGDVTSGGRPETRNPLPEGFQLIGAATETDVRVGIPWQQHATSAISGWHSEAGASEAIGSIGTSCSMCSLCRVLSMVLEFVPQRSGYIKNVVLLEGDSIVLLPECCESSGV